VELLVKVLVYNFSLAISLRIKYNRELDFNPKDIIKLILEIWYKLRAIVRDNWLRSIVYLVNIINIYIGYILCNYNLKVKEGNSLFT